MVAHLLRKVVEFGVGDFEGLAEEGVERFLGTIVGRFVLSGAEGSNFCDSEY